MLDIRISWTLESGLEWSGVLHSTHYLGFARNIKFCRSPDACPSTSFLSSSDYCFGAKRKLGDRARAGVGLSPDPAIKRKHEIEFLYFLSKKEMERLSRSFFWQLFGRKAPETIFSPKLNVCSLLLAGPFVSNGKRWLFHWRKSLGVSASTSFPYAPRTWGERDFVFVIMPQCRFRFFQAPLFEKEMQESLLWSSRRCSIANYAAASPWFARGGKGMLWPFKLLNCHFFSGMLKNAKRIRKCPNMA